MVHRLRAVVRRLLRREQKHRPHWGVPAGGVEPLERRALFSGATADFVIHVSVDGLRPDAVTALGPSELPNLYRLRSEGAFTDNARTDYDTTKTLPNHVGQVTGRPLYGCGPEGTRGHGWFTNKQPPRDRTLHRNAGAYVASVWDVAHDNGLRTGLFASKRKFSLFDQSYDADKARRQGGARDTTGADDGRDKIDHYHHGRSAAIADALLAAIKEQPFHYVLVHFSAPDIAGHAKGWMGARYLAAVRETDAQVGRLLTVIESTPATAGRTAMILTSDHGGGGNEHRAAGAARNYTIPFYVWGPGVVPGADLYALNAGTRDDPGPAAPGYHGIQPVRNGDAANLALDFLDLPPVPGSVFNVDQRLRVTAEGVGAIPGGAGIPCDHDGPRPRPSQSMAEPVVLRATPPNYAWMVFAYGRRLLLRRPDGGIVSVLFGDRRG